MNTDGRTTYTRTVPGKPAVWLPGSRGEPGGYPVRPTATCSMGGTGTEGWKAAQEPGFDPQGTEVSWKGLKPSGKTSRVAVVRIQGVQKRTRW